MVTWTRLPTSQATSGVAKASRWLFALDTPNFGVVPTPDSFGQSDREHSVGSSAEIVTGMVFRATLQLRTPLVALEHHGEVRPVGSELPQYGPPWGGAWTPLVQSVNDILVESGLSIHVTDSAPRTMPSEWGPISCDGGNLLPALIAYHRIVEAPGTMAERCAALRELQSSNHRGVNYLPKDLDVRFAAHAIEEVLGIGLKLAAELYRAGFVDIDAIRAAPDAELLKIRGIGQIKLDGIRAVIGGGSDMQD